jgi:cytochrome c biogenesis protein CcmG/thiol:disulfide interchange protein DsbE
MNIFDQQGTLGLDLGVYGAPETYLVDKNGVIRYRRVGVVDDRVWNDELKALYEQLMGAVQ